MDSLRKFLGLEEESLPLGIVWILIVVAYLFNIAVRYIYVGYIDNQPQFFFNGQLMINTNDGYYWAEGARDILNGSHQPNDLSPVDTLAAETVAFFAKIVPVSFETLIFYLPGFLASLVVVPLVFIGRVLGSSWIGFLAALLGGMAWSFYHRTMFGYIDTDMLVIVFPVSVIALVMYGFVKNQKRYMLLAALLEIAMMTWHSGLSNVANGLFVMGLVYAILFKRDSLESAFLLLYLVLPVLPLPLTVKVVSILVYGVLHHTFLERKKAQLEKKAKAIWIGFGLVVALYTVAVGVPWLLEIAKSGYFTRAVTQSADGDNLHYFSVVNTVREAGHISYDTIVHRISGSWIGFILGLAGYVLLLIRYPILLLSLPMVVLGFFTIKGGLRFTIFAVPFMALGDAYIAYLIGRTLKKLTSEKMQKVALYAISLVVMAGFIYPNYQHIHKYLVPTVLSKDEVKTLQQLKHIAKRDDYVLSWWDYGYPIRYYADVKTLADGGKHSGDVNFPVSFALTRDLTSSRNMAILDVYETEKSFQKHKGSDYIRYMMEDFNLSDPNDLFAMLQNDALTLPKIKEDIYYFLPYRMIDIFPTVATFSTIDLKTGRQKQHFFYAPKGVRQQGNTLLLPGGVKILLATGEIEIGTKKLPIHHFVQTYYDKTGKLQKSMQGNPLVQHGVNVIFMKNYGRWLILDDFYYNSTFVQLFVLENTGGLFEPVILSPLVKIYKVKK